MSLRERLHELLEDIAEEDLPGLERVLEELALRQRMRFMALKQQAIEAAAREGQQERPAAEGRGGQYTGLDEHWANFHWGRPR